MEPDTPGAAPDARASLSERLSAISREIHPNASGADVLAVHEYLTAFGYFPSAALSAKYPNWRPIILSPPARADIFDERSQCAVRSLQRHAGLDATGIVDERTRDFMLSPRCGVPDGSPHSNHSATDHTVDKFALAGSRLQVNTTWAPRDSLKWSFQVNAGDPIGLTAM